MSTARFDDELWTDHKGNIWRIIPPARTRDRGYRKKLNALREYIFHRDGNICQYCGSTKCLSLDHIKPLRAGGSNNPDNCQCLCHSCNAKKVKTDRNLWG